MNSMNAIINEAQQFQSSVKKLSTDVKEAGVNWNDEKHQALSKMIYKIASNSKGVIVAADKLSSNFKRFESIASQN